jgi:hypothetical protein
MEKALADPWIGHRYLGLTAYLDYEKALADPGMHGHHGSPWGAAQRSFLIVVVGKAIMRWCG